MSKAAIGVLLLGSRNLGVIMDGKQPYRGVLMALLQRYYSQGAPKPDPRKQPNPRRPLRTDARTGYGYFFGDNGEKREYVTFSPDRSTTRAVWNRMRDLGVHVPGESFDVFHARTMNGEKP